MGPPARRGHRGLRPGGKSDPPSSDKSGLWRGKDADVEFEGSQISHGHTQTHTDVSPIVFQSVFVSVGLWPII